MPAVPKTSLRSHLRKHWFAVEAIPIYVIIGGVLAGATWYVSRLATGPNIVWTKNNPTPWNTIKPDEGTKLVEVNHKFDKSYVYSFAGGTMPDKYLSPLVNLGGHVTSYKL